MNFNVSFEENDKSFDVNFQNGSNSFNVNFENAVIVDDKDAVKSVNGILPDEDGNVTLDIPECNVTSINGHTGEVVLTAEDVGALPKDTVIPSIEGLATESYVDNAVNNIEIPEVDLTPYAKKEDIPSIEGLASEDYVKEVIANIEVPEGEAVNPDWEQNDPTAKDYIKNRPFYNTVTEILDLGEITITENDFLETYEGDEGIFYTDYEGYLDEVIYIPDLTLKTIGLVATIDDKEYEYYDRVEGYSICLFDDNVWLEYYIDEDENGYFIHGWYFSMPHETEPKTHLIKSVLKEKVYKTLDNSYLDTTRIYNYVFDDFGMLNKKTINNVSVEVKELSYAEKRNLSDIIAIPSNEGEYNLNAKFPEHLGFIKGRNTLSISCRKLNIGEYQSVSSISGETFGHAGNDLFNCFVIEIKTYEDSAENPCMLVKHGNRPNIISGLYMSECNYLYSLRVTYDETSDKWTINITRIL